MSATGMQVANGEMKYAEFKSSFIDTAVKRREVSATVVAPPKPAPPLPEVKPKPPPAPPPEAKPRAPPAPPPEAKVKEPPAPPPPKEEVLAPRSLAKDLPLFNQYSVHLVQQFPLALLVRMALKTHF
jgi:hypothetical protein